MGSEVHAAAASAAACCTICLRVHNCWLLYLHVSVCLAFRSLTAKKKVALFVHDVQITIQAFQSGELQETLERALNS